MKKLLLLLAILLIQNCVKEPPLEPHPQGKIESDPEEFTLYSKNTGIHPDTSVLDDPNNIFADISISMDFKWDVASYANSAEKFYMWATVLARGPHGEPQFYTGVALEGLGLTQQAIRAYQAILKYFPNDITILADGSEQVISEWAINNIENLGGTVEGYAIVAVHGKAILVETD